jgi:membrane fusion protein, multidrug efflux system
VALRTRVTVISIAVVAIGGAAAWYFLQGPQPVRTGRGPGLPIPVFAAEVTKRDLPIYLTGLGAVQASFTVGIRTQVDGQLAQVLFVEGQHVKKDDIVAKIDPRLYQAALDQAKAKKMQDEAQLISAQKDLDRSNTLVARRVETQQLVDQQQAKVDQMIAMIAADEAAIETAQTNFDYTSIRAPSDGRMGVRMIDPGNIVHASDAALIATLTLTRPSAVLFTLSARSLTDVREAIARGPVEVTAFSQDNQRTLGTGKLLLIDNIVDQASATMRLKAMFANDDEQLWPGDFVNARVLLEVRQNVLTIPSPAIQRGPDGIFAWVITANDTVQVRKIVSGPTTNVQTIITSGLAAGERVVVDGQYKLQQNSKVQVTVPAQAQTTVPTSAVAKRE